MPKNRDPQQTDQEPHVGMPGRIVVPSTARLPELAAAPGGADRFDAETMTGEVEAYPSIIGRAYRMGFYTWHQIEPGAFDASLEEQGGRVPIYVQHNWDWSERAPIGNTSAAEEVELEGADDGARALKITGRLYPDVPDGLAVLHAMAAGALREWSIGYVIEEYRVEDDEESGRSTIFITKAELWEASVVLRGANPWTQTLDVAQRPDLLTDEIRRREGLPPAPAPATAATPPTPMPPASDEKTSGPEPARISIEQLADRRRRQRLHELTR